jgi:hypothetical protein
VANVNWGFDMDIAALIAIGAVASTLFWRMINRLEEKVDRLIDRVDERLAHTMSKEECKENRRLFGLGFKKHYHIPDDGIGILVEEEDPIRVVQK